MSKSRTYDRINTQLTRALKLTQSLDAHLTRKVERFDFEKHRTELLLLTELTLAARLLATTDPLGETEKLMDAAEKVVGYVDPEE